MLKRFLAMAGLCAALAALGLVAPATAPAQAQELTWTAADSLTEYKSAPATAKPGETTIVFENSEATGNTSGVSHTLTFDTTTEGYNHDVDLNITASPFDADDGRHEATVTLTPGKYRYHCTIPGHGQMVGELVVSEDGGGGGDDNAPPTVKAEVTGDQNGDGDYIGSASVALNATDEGSGVDTVEYKLDDGEYQGYSEPVNVEGAGEHTVTYRATDKAGNTSQEGSVTLTIVEGDPNDTTPPEVTAKLDGDKDADGNYVGKATVTLDATDSGSGVGKTEYKLDDAEFAEYTKPVEVAAPGEHTVTYRATDNSGNTSEAGTAKFSVVEVDDGDQDPPVVKATVSGLQDANWNYVGKATVTLSATDEESGVRTLRYSLDGGSYTPYGEPVVLTDPGKHTVLFHAVDQIGNRSEDGKRVFSIVAEAGDRCVGSDVRDTVMIAKNDSTVPNVETENGCTIADLVTKHTSMQGHGHQAHHGKQMSYVEHVRQVADGLVSDGLISDSERSRLVTAAK